MNECYQLQALGIQGRGDDGLSILVPPNTQLIYVDCTFEIGWLSLDSARKRIKVWFFAALYVTYPSKIWWLLVSTKYLLNQLIEHTSWCTLGITIILHVRTQSLAIEFLGSFFCTCWSLLGVIFTIGYYWYHWPWSFMVDNNTFTKPLPAAITYWLYSSYELVVGSLTNDWAYELLVVEYKHISPCFTMFRHY